MNSAHSPAAERARRIRADRQRIQPRIDLIRGIATGSPPTPDDVFHVNLALWVVRREEALEDDLPATTLNLLAELSREAKAALHRLIMAVSDPGDPLTIARKFDCLLAEHALLSEIGKGESSVWQALRIAIAATSSEEDKLSAPRKSEPEYAMIRVGKGNEAKWQIAFEGEQGTVKDCLGAGYVAERLRIERETLVRVDELHVGREPQVKQNRPQVEYGDNAAELEQLAEARAEIQHRIDRDEADDEDRRGLDAIIERVKELRDPAGRPRKGDPLAASRAAVTNAIKRFIGKCRDAGLPRFADHLENYLRTGNHVLYDHPTPPAWEIES